MKRWSSIVSQARTCSRWWKSWSNRSSRPWPNKAWPQIPAFSAQIASNQRLDPEMGARPLRRVLQTEVEDQLAELLLKGRPRRANHQGWNDSRNDQVRDCLGGRHDASAINPYFAFGGLCVALRRALPFPKCPTYFCHLFFSWWYLKGIALLFLWWWSPCLSPPFPGDEPDCVLSDCRLWLFDAHLAHQLQRWLPCPSDPFLWAYCPLLMGSWSIVFMPWYTIFLGGPMLWSMVLV